MGLRLDPGVFTQPVNQKFGQFIASWQIAEAGLDVAVFQPQVAEDS